MIFCDCVQDYFRAYLMQQRGYGDHTLASYRDTFKLLVEFLSSSGLEVDALEMAEVGKDAVAGFLCWLESARGNAPSTRNVRLAHLKSFASYVITMSPEDAGACAAIRSIPAKRQQSAPPDALSKEEVGCLLAMPGTDGRQGLRDSALLSLLYDSACRATELANMDVRDLVLGSACYVRIDGKGNKKRTVPLLGETGELLAAYLAATALGPDSPLFVNRSGRRLSRSGVSDVVERHWKSVVERHPDAVSHASVKPHLLRHSKASHLVEAGANIYYVRDFLGHESVETTMVYLRRNLEKMREAVEVAADALAKPSGSFYTPDRKAELLAFLDTLV